MVSVNRKSIQLLHHIRCIPKVIDGFKQWNDVNCNGITPATRSNKKSEYLKDVNSTVTLTDDVPVATRLTISVLNGSDCPDCFNRILFNKISILRYIN